MTSPGGSFSRRSPGRVERPKRKYWLVLVSFMGEEGDRIGQDE